MPRTNIRERLQQKLVKRLETPQPSFELRFRKGKPSRQALGDKPDTLYMHDMTRKELFLHMYGLTDTLLNRSVEKTVKIRSDDYLELDARMFDIEAHHQMKINCAYNPAFKLYDVTDLVPVAGITNVSDFFIGMNGNMGVVMNSAAERVYSSVFNAVHPGLEKLIRDRNEGLEYPERFELFAVTKWYGGRIWLQEHLWLRLTAYLSVSPDIHPVRRADIAQLRKTTLDLIPKADYDANTMYKLSCAYTYYYGSCKGSDDIDVVDIRNLYWARLLSTGLKDLELGRVQTKADMPPQIANASSASQIANTPPPIENTSWVEEYHVPKGKKKKRSRRRK